MAFGLTIGGGYIAIDNLIHPQGNLFEGIVLTALGLITFLLLTIANNIGNTILMFKEIYVNQLEMQQKMMDFYSEVRKPGPMSIGDLLGRMGGAGSMTITNLQTGETSSAPIGGQDGIVSFNDLIQKSLGKYMETHGSGKELKDMNREELEAQLANAVKKDDYEKAAEIKQLLRNLDNPGDNKEDKTE